MLDLGLSELIVILAVALIVLGPQKLPEIARNLGRGLAQFRRASEDLRRSILLGEEAERLEKSFKSSASLSPLENQKEFPEEEKSVDIYSSMAKEVTEEDAAQAEKQDPDPAAESSKEISKRPTGWDED